MRALLYVFFIVIMMHIHALPLFAMRPMYLSVRAFKKTLMDVILSRRAIRYSLLPAFYAFSTPPLFTAYVTMPKAAL